MNIDDVTLDLSPCPSCGRTFRPEALAKHSKVCEKILMRKRKTFDSSKQRLQGTDLEAYAHITTTMKTSKSNTPTQQQKNNTMKYRNSTKSREIGNTSVTVDTNTINLTSSSHSAKPSDHQQCPHCDRFFGPKAYSRHVEWCKDQQLKVKHSSTNVEAKERLQVRTGYRAPLPNKVLTRDKYQPATISFGRHSRDSSLTKGESKKPKSTESSLDRTHTFSMPKSPTKQKATKNNKNSSNNNSANINCRKSTLSTPNKQASSAFESESEQKATPPSGPLKINTLPKIISNTHKGRNAAHHPAGFGGDKEQGDKKSGDSAYSSLTRALNDGDYNSGGKGGEQPKFCHECGTQYPVALAKFCCFCGMRRIAI